MKSLFNVFQIVGWSYVLFDTIFNIVDDPSKIMNLEAGNTFGRALFVMKIVQTAQILDFVLSSGSIVSVLAQYLGRMIVGWLFLNEKTSALTLSCVLIPWAFADIIRYTYYINKSDLISFLRYNAFMVLYPIGVFLGEIPCMEQYLKFLPLETEFYEILYYFCRVVQIGVFIGMPLLASYLFKSRKSYYRKRAEKEKVSTTSNTPKSSNKKRD